MSDGIDRMLALLEANGLPVVYGGPGTVGSTCPLCPPQLGPFGTRYIAESMVLQFGDGAVRIRCLGGCRQTDILNALRHRARPVAPQLREAA